MARPSQGVITRKTIIKQALVERELTDEEKESAEITKRCKEESKRLQNTFQVIRIEAKRYEWEDDVPTVALNGEPPIQMKRGYLIPVAYPIVCALNESKHLVYKQDPGSERKVVGEFSRIPFSIIRDRISPKAYRELRLLATQKETGITDSDLDRICSENPYEGKHGDVQLQ